MEAQSLPSGLEKRIQNEIDTLGKNSQYSEITRDGNEVKFKYKQKDYAEKTFDIEITLNSNMFPLFTKIIIKGPDNFYFENNLITKCKCTV